MHIPRRALLAGAVSFGAAGPSLAQTATPGSGAWAARLVTAAQAQIGVTKLYDPAYVKLDYPGGDVPRDRGVCTDVVVRAYRDAFGLDLQRLVHEDMKRAFTAYPGKWGTKRPDHNIDHRRVPNLETFFTRHDAALKTSQEASAFQPGDLVSQRLPGELPHIAIVTGRHQEGRPLLIHNIGSGAKMEDILFAYRIVGHFRYKPA